MSKSNHFYELFEVVGIWLSLEGMEDTLLQYFLVFYTPYYGELFIHLRILNQKLDSGTIFSEY